MVFKVAILRGRLVVTIRAGRRGTPSSATVSQSPAALLLTEVIGCGAEESTGGGRAAERSGGATATCY